MSFKLLATFGLLAGVVLLSGDSAETGNALATKPGMLAATVEAQESEAISLLQTIEGYDKPPAKLDSALYRLMQSAQSNGLELARSEAQRRSLAMVDGHVRVEIQAEAGQADVVLNAVAWYGGTVEARWRDWIQALVPVESLLAVYQTDAVVMVRKPAPLALQAITTEGASLIGTGPWHEGGLKGHGIKIGVIDSFADYEPLLGTELPASSQIVYRNFSANPGRSAHGTAVAEIIHDIAPEATLYLAEADLFVEVGDAVDWLIDQRVHIINMSGGSNFWGPGDGTGPINSMVNDAINRGILWVNAAGNSADQHWLGRWSDPNEDGLHNFSGDVQLNLITVGATPIVLEGESIEATLKWNDPWVGACNDYDLLLIYNDPDLGPTLADSSGDVQNCRLGHQPIESISYIAEASGTYGLAIAASGDVVARDLELFVGDPFQLSYLVSGSSIFPPADNRNVIAVGAVNVGNPGVVEPYSSQGPTKDGRVKPDVVGPSGVSTSTFGFKGYHGTSSSSPHTAAGAALVKQANPGFTRQQLAQFLEQRAVDLGANGKDNVYGAGRLNLGGVPALGPHMLLFGGWNVGFWRAEQCKASIDAFDNLIESGLLNVSAMFIASGQSWLLFDPDAPDVLNTLTQICHDDIIWLNVSDNATWLQR